MAAASSILIGGYASTGDAAPVSGDASLSSWCVSPQLRRCVAGVRRCVAFVGDHVAALPAHWGHRDRRRVPLIVPALLSCNMQSAVNVADLKHLLARQHPFLDRSCGDTAKVVLHRPLTLRTSSTCSPGGRAFWPVRGAGDGVGVCTAAQGHTFGFTAVNLQFPRIGFAVAAAARP